MRKLATPTRQFHIQLPEEEASRLELHLWSEAEQRIPYASRQRFIVERIREYFGRRTVDLAAYFPNLPAGTFLVHGDEATMNVLKERLHVFA